MKHSFTKKIYLLLFGLFIALMAGSSFAWLWSMVVYAPALLGASMTLHANPDSFRYAALIALTAGLILFPCLGKKRPPACSSLYAVRVITLGFSSAAIGSLAILVLPHVCWSIAGALCGLGIAAALTATCIFLTHLESEQLMTVAEAIIVTASIMHLPVAALVRFFPITFVIIYIAISLFAWMIPYGLIKKKTDFMQKSSIPVKPTEDVSIEGRSFWLAFFLILFLLFVISGLLFQLLFSGAAVSLQDWDTRRLSWIRGDNSSWRFTPDLLGLLGTLVYALSAAAAVLLSRRVEIHKLLLYAITVLFASVTFWLFGPTSLSVILSFFILQSALAFVDILFWNLLLTLALKLPSDAERNGAWFMAFYAICGFVPYLFTSFGALAMQKAGALILVLLFIAMWIFYYFSVKGFNLGLLTDYQLRDIMGDTSKPSQSHAPPREESLPEGNCLPSLPSIEERILVRFSRAGLTKRESEIALLVLRGFSAVEIMEQCGIRKNTLKTHMRNILGKTACSNTKDLLLQILNREK